LKAGPNTNGSAWRQNPRLIDPVEHQDPTQMDLTG